MSILFTILRRGFGVLTSAVTVSLIVTPAYCYENPLVIRNIGDPAVLQYNGMYYLYATTNTIDGNTDSGFKCWTSPDLVAWSGGPWVMLEKNSTWGKYYFWDPEVHFKNGKFYMFYSARAVRNGKPHICLAVSNSPTGPFADVTAPLVNTVYGEISPHLFTDTNGRCYLYWSATQTPSYNTIGGQEISPDFLRLIGTPNHNIIGPPFSRWEIASFGYPIVEGPMMIKRQGVYYLTYSGANYLDTTYAVGYADSSSPLGPFVRFPGNPILKTDFSGKRKVSGPGSHHFVKSLDGTETLMVYAAHTNPDNPTADRSVYMDRIAFQNNILKVIGPTTSCQRDPSHGTSATFTNCYDHYYTTATMATGWDRLGLNTPGVGYSYHEPQRDEFVMHVSKGSGARITGAATSPNNWFPYSDIGPDNYVRLKYAVYATNQMTNDPNEVPNVRFRAATRFAVTAMLDVLHHNSSDPGVTTVARELAPSKDPARPSVYTFDFDPVDVPLMSDGATTEGVMRGFEVWCAEPQENGAICVVESSISVYPSSATPSPGDTQSLVKVLEPGAFDAGSIRALNPSTDIHRMNWVEGLYIDDAWTRDPGSPRATHREAGLNSVTPPPGVTLDSADVPTNRIGIIARDFTPAPTYTSPDYVRVEPGKQYKIRYHLTSTGASNENARIQMRARSVRWSWTQKLILGGASAAGPRNNTLAAQVLPGIGCMNHDKNGFENGGWYTMIVNSPLDPGIRPEFPPEADISQRMPHLFNEPGPQVNAYSRRDLRVSLDMVDSESRTPDRIKEKGNVTVDRVEIYAYDAVK